MSQRMHGYLKYFNDLYFFNILILKHHDNHDSKLIVVSVLDGTVYWTISSKAADQIGKLSSIYETPKVNLLKNIVRIFAFLRSAYYLR